MRLFFFIALAFSLTVLPGVPFAESSKSFKPLRLPVLGLVVECVDSDDGCRLISTYNPKILFEGPVLNCEQRLVDTLVKRHGLGNLNMGLPTLGGKQYWSDVFYSSDL